MVAVHSRWGLGGRRPWTPVRGHAVVLAAPQALGLAGGGGGVTRFRCSPRSVLEVERAPRRRGVRPQAPTLAPRSLARRQQQLQLEFLGEAGPKRGHPPARRKATVAAGARQAETLAGDLARHPEAQHLAGSKTVGHYFDVFHRPPVFGGADVVVGIASEYEPHALPRLRRQERDLHHLECHAVPVGVPRGARLIPAGLAAVGGLQTPLLLRRPLRRQLPRVQR
mmetsp:Transcript_123158/g.353824  ORF Transcript_123158/g.353824 Transcript_123158/m.353824 type:complete len:224 (+) Transcript_123158:1325-1996(+)